MTEVGDYLDAHTLRFERLLPGPVERTWDYLANPERLSTWLAVADIDPRAGGRVELRFNTEELPERHDGGAVIGGFITRCDAPRCLSYTWVDKSPGTATDNGADASHVSFELEPRADQVLLILTHDRLPTAWLAKCGAGWHSHLDVLAARLRWQTPDNFADTFRRVLPLYEQRLAQRQTD
jgi:uncharacterized protein YndB with AHSA1/START domain